MPINAARSEVMLITTTVEPINSWRLDQDTLVNSTFTSLKKLAGFEKIFIHPGLFESCSCVTQERQESNLQSRFWRPLVCH